MGDEDVVINAVFDYVFNVIIGNYEHGTVTADRTQAFVDEIITLKVTPDEGYQLKSLTAESSGAPELKRVGNSASDTWTLTIGQSRTVTINAVFEQKSY